MKRILSFLTLSLAILGMANAVVVQRVTLKNGSVLNGYVQQATNGLLTFHSDNATVIIDNANVDTPEQTLSVARLDSAWIKWADRNDAFEGVGNNRSLTLNSIVFRGNILEDVVDSAAVAVEESSTKSEATKKKKNPGFSYFLKQKRTIANVKVLEKGVNVKYLEQTPNVYTISWYDVASIEIDRRPKTALSGINCSFQLRSGESYEGQKAGESLTTMNLYLDNGVVQSFNIDDIIKYIYRPINPNQDIFAQSELADVIKTTYGNELRGIIIEENYSGKTDAENYMLLQQESGAIQSIKISEITEMIKEENPKYHPLFDILLKEGDIVLNRQEFQYVGVTETDEVMTLDSLRRSNVIAKGSNNTPIVVEYRDDTAGNVMPFQLLKVTKTAVKKQVVYCFTYKDMVNSVVTPTKVSTSINHTTRAEFLVEGQGVFILYDAKKHRGIPIIIKPKE